MDAPLYMYFLLQPCWSSALCLFGEGSSVSIGCIIISERRDYIPSKSPGLEVGVRIPKTPVGEVGVRIPKTPVGEFGVHCETLVHCAA